MKIKNFGTEHFFAEYEFTTPHLLCCSDCETISVKELLKMADISLDDFGELRMNYTESLGNPELRQLIADMYAKVDVEDVLVLGTPVEGIYLAACAVLDPGDEVIVLAPAYDALINMFEHVVGDENVKKWKFKPGNETWELDTDDLKQLISSKTKMLVVNFPHNPTGFLPSPEQQAEIILIAEEHNLILFYDEMYFGLIHSGPNPIPSAADLSKKTIVLSGLSKTYGLPGLRSGWLIIQDEEIRENIINWKFYTSICPPAPSEFLAMAALKVREQLRDRNISIIEKNLEIADAFFSRWPDLFTWRKPLAGSVGLVGVNVPSVSLLSKELIKAGVLIQPAGMLGMDDKHIRMGFGRLDFEVGLAKFEEWLEDNTI